MVSYTFTYKIEEEPPKNGEFVFRGEIFLNEMSVVTSWQLDESCDRAKHKIYSEIRDQLSEIMLGAAALANKIPEDIMNDYLDKSQNELSNTHLSPLELKHIQRNAELRAKAQPISDRRSNDVGYVGYDIEYNGQSKAVVIRGYNNGYEMDYHIGCIDKETLDFVQSIPSTIIMNVIDKLILFKGINAKTGRIFIRQESFFALEWME